MAVRNIRVTAIVRVSLELVRLSMARVRSPTDVYATVVSGWCTGVGRRRKVPVRRVRIMRAIMIALIVAVLWCMFIVSTVAPRPVTVTFATHCALLIAGRVALI